MGFADTVEHYSVQIVPSAHFVIKELTFFLEAEKSKRKAITAQCNTQWSIITWKKGIDNRFLLETVMNEIRKLKMSADFFANTSNDICRCPGV